MKRQLSAGLILCILCSAIVARGQEAYVTFGRQSKQAAARSYHKGQRAARRDLRKGKFKIKTYGLPDQSAYEFGSILQSEYGIELDWVAACVVPVDIVNEVAGFNAVMMAAIEKKFGKGIVEAAERRAEQMFTKFGTSGDFSADQQPPLQIMSPSALPQIDLPPPPPPPTKKPS